MNNFYVTSQTLKATEGITRTLPRRKQLTLSGSDLLEKTKQTVLN